MSVTCEKLRRLHRAGYTVHSGSWYSCQYRAGRVVALAVLTVVRKSQRRPIRGLRRCTRCTSVSSLRPRIAPRERHNLRSCSVGPVDRICSSPATSGTAYWSDMSVITLPQGAHKRSWSGQQESDLSLYGVPTLFMPKRSRPIKSSTSAGITSARITWSGITWSRGWNPSLGSPPLEDL